MQVRIHIPPALAKTLEADKSAIPSPIEGFAIIDTGATYCAVDKKSISELGINPIGTAKMGAATGSSSVNIYPGRLELPNMKTMFDHNRLMGVSLSGLKIPGINGPLIALLGRDFLRHFVFIYNGDVGRWTLAGGPAVK